MRVLRPRRFWTPRYIRNRLALAAWQRRRPDAPWLAPRAVSFLDQVLRPSDVVVEFGSGRSTLWFARRVRYVVSVEHNRDWYSKVGRQLEAAGLRNVTCVYAPNAPGTYARAAEAALLAYGDTATIALVDGRQRDECALWALDHLASTGLLIVDNAERYLPGPSCGPASIGPGAPPASDLWQQFSERTRGLRRIWFESGVSETLVFWLEPGGFTRAPEASGFEMRATPAPSK